MFSSLKHAYIMLTPLNPTFFIVKLGFTEVYIIFLISAQKHRLWVLVRTASPSFSLSQNFQFLEVKFSLYLNRRVFVMLSLWGLHRLGSFSAIFYKGGNLHDFLLVFLQNKPLLKRVYSWEQIISF